MANTTRAYTVNDGPDPTRRGGLAGAAGSGAQAIDVGGAEFVVQPDTRLLRGRVRVKYLNLDRQCRTI